MLYHSVLFFKSWQDRPKAPKGELSISTGYLLKQVIEEQISKTEKQDFGLHQIQVRTEGRPASYAIKAGPSMPKIPVIRHQTLINIKNANSQSSKKIVYMLQHLRCDVPVEPYADEMLAKTNHILDGHFVVSYEEMDIQVEQVEEKDTDKVNKTNWLK